MWNDNSRVQRTNRIHNICYLEFVVGENKDGDITYTFHPIGSHSINKFNEYTTVITLNELSEDLEGNLDIIRTECTCNAFKHFKKDCKHIKDAKKILKERGVKIKEIPLTRYWCTICKSEAQAEPNQNVICFKCMHKMNEAKNEQREKDKDE